MTSIIKYFLPPIMIFTLVSCGIVDSEQITDIMEKKQQIDNKLGQLKKTQKQKKKLTTEKKQEKNK